MHCDREPDSPQHPRGLSISSKPFAPNRSQHQTSFQKGNSTQRTVIVRLSASITVTFQIIFMLQFILLNGSWIVVIHYGLRGLSKNALRSDIISGSQFLWWWNIKLIGVMLLICNLIYVPLWPDKTITSIYWAHPSCCVCHSCQV